MKCTTILLLVLVVMVSAFLSDWGLTESSEARYAEISREMYLSGDFVSPTLLGIKHFHKPPVVYYITSAGYAIFGVSEFGARFFMAIALLLQLFFVYRIADLLYNDKRVSTAALLIYFSFPITQIAAKNLTTDCYLTTFIFAGIFFFLSHIKSRRIIWLYLFYTSCGLAFLTKGPVGILPQGLFAIGYYVLIKPKRNFTVHNIAALLLGILIGVSWYVVLIYQNQHLLSYFFKHQLVERVATDKFSRAKPFWYYFLTMPLLGMPAIIFFIDYGLRCLKKHVISDSITRLLNIVLLACLLIFSLAASKLVLYVLPLYLFIAIVGAKNLLEISAARSRLLLNITTGFFIFLFGALSLAALFQYRLVFPAWHVSVLSAIAIICLLVMRLGGRMGAYIRAPLSAAIGMLFLLSILSSIANQNELTINSIKPVAAIIKSDEKNSEKALIVYNQFLPSLEFYTNKRIITVNNGNIKTEREIQFEDGRRHYMENYFKLPGDSARLRIFTEQHDIVVVARKTDTVPGSLYFLKNKNGRLLFKGNWVIDL